MPCTDGTRTKPPRSEHSDKQWRWAGFSMGSHPQPVYAWHQCHLPSHSNTNNERTPVCSSKRLELFLPFFGWWEWLAECASVCWADGEQLATWRTCQLWWPAAHQGRAARHTLRTQCWGTDSLHRLSPVYHCLQTAKWLEASKLVAVRCNSYLWDARCLFMKRDMLRGCSVWPTRHTVITDVKCIWLFGDFKAIVELFYILFYRAVQQETTRFLWTSHLYDGLWNGILCVFIYQYFTALNQLLKTLMVSVNFLDLSFCVLNPKKWIQFLMQLYSHRSQMS